MNTKRLAASLLLGVLLAACTGTPTSPPPAGSPSAPSPTPITTSGPTITPPGLPAATIPTPQATPAAALTPPAVSPPTPSPTPTPGPTPSASPTLVPASAPVRLPLVAAKLPARTTDLWSATLTQTLISPQGVVYVLLVDGEDRTSIAALDDKGRPLPGWPVVIAGGWLRTADIGADGTLYLILQGDDDTQELAALPPDGLRSAGWLVRLEPGDLGPTCDSLIAVGDGTVRLVCTSYSGGDLFQAYAFDRQGRALPGWPVALPSPPCPDAGPPCIDPPEPIVVGTSLVGIASGNGWARRFTVAADGSLRLGKTVMVPSLEFNDSCYEDLPALLGSLSLGPDGTGYLWAIRAGRPRGSGDCRFISATYTAFDDDGVRAGWPVTVAGETSDPVPGPDGRVYVTQGDHGRRPTRVYAFDAHGRRVPGWPVRFDLARDGGYGKGGWLPTTVSLGPRGTVYLSVRDGPSGIDNSTTVYALDPTGKVLPGWPYRARMPLAAWEMYCGCTGGSSAPLPPVIDAAGRVHLVLGDIGEGQGLGSHATLVQNGRTAPGWPVTLRRATSYFVDLTVDAAGVTYVLAKELEGSIGQESVSETLLAIAPDGTVLYRTTVLEP